MFLVFEWNTSNLFTMLIMNIYDVFLMISTKVPHTKGGNLRLGLQHSMAGSVH